MQEPVCVGGVVGSVGVGVGSGSGVLPEPRMPVTSPLPPSKTTSEQEKKFSWLSERTHCMKINASPERPEGSARSQ